MTDKPKRIGIAPFDRDMIVEHLTSRSIEYDIDDDGDFRFGLSIEGNDDFPLAVFLGAEGTNEDILVLRAIGMVAIPQEGWMQVMSACNQWNIERRFPKAALVISNVEPGNVEPGDGVPEGTTQAGQVHLMAHFPLGAGVTQPLVDDLISENIGGALQFWQWMPGWVQDMANQQGGAGSADPGDQVDPSLN
jgi:hypothetical protein